ncbi:MAG: hypothetical protein JW845_03505 [Dehalococcoidales bacterium]|nr:hypothetical protein [Dehalococcoidales bacterium]
MKSKALKQLVREIFSDEKTKQQFLSNPDSVISQYPLTKQEKQAILNTHAKLGLATSNSGQLEAVIGPMGTWS